MKNIKTFYDKVLPLSLCLLFTISSSCNKLDEMPQGFATPDNFYNTPSQVESAFSAAMHQLWSAWNAYGYGMQVFHNDFQENGGNLIIPDDWGSGLWAAHYAAILNINAAIKAMNGGKLAGASQPEIGQLMGQARFLRAYNYFMLVRMFGGIPLITDSTNDPYHAQLKRSSIADVYNLIIGDFNYAIANLPATWPASQKGRPTADAARGLLAKVYLTMATYPLNEPQYYQNAAELARQVIQNGNYHLIDSINQVFGVATQYGPEMMWSFNSNLIDPATDPHIWSDMDGWGDFAADPIWVANYPDQPRKAAYVQITSKGGVNYLATGNLPGVQKYLYDSPSDYNAGISIINVPIIRYADVLLIYAEAENMVNGGPTQTAVDAIDQVINRANGYVPNPQDPLATLSMSKEAFDAKVIQERNYELCFEYDRWFDIIRKRILPEVADSSVRQNFTPNDYLFPIPSQDIRLDPNLTQNPGY
ncbi:MAG: RagB/SusD family nutrient uptake outer membrane protein [Chitinophagaceae bacterium]|nr:MAG: RagB/SusD family nutrient uptake outer membrane protein [Chitinophagaceae bacterium]